MEAKMAVWKVEEGEQIEMKLDVDSLESNR
jgi:hypothetical protein